MALSPEVTATLQGLSQASFADEADRMRTRDVLFNALRQTQNPWDLAWDHTWVSPVISAVVRTLVDLDTFRIWDQETLGFSRPVTATRLAELTGADPLLMTRLMRTASGQRLLAETGEPYTYRDTAWVRAMARDPAFPGIYGDFSTEFCAPGLRVLPSFLRATGYRNPTDVQRCNFQHWRGAGADYFAFMASSTKEMKDSFNDAMTSHSQWNLSQWHDIYPTGRVARDADAAAAHGVPLLVDIGGGQGHDLVKFAEANAGALQASSSSSFSSSSSSRTAGGSLVLVDLPDILADVDFPSSSSIRARPHDMFEPLPDDLRGARAYFMHNVLHDWPDGAAAGILRNVARGMVPGWSTLLVHESLLTDVDPPSRVAVSDMHMMAWLAAAERSESQWSALFEGAGMRIVKIWRPGAGEGEGLMEVELA